MATILNPTPVTPQTFDGMWVQNLQIFLPKDQNGKGFIHSRLLPYDGINLLALGGKDVRKPIVDNATKDMISALIAEVQRLKDTQAIPVQVAVSAQNPAQPVRVFIRFDDKTHYRIEDCFALAETDETFAGVLFVVMSEIARLAGLEIDI